MTYYLDRDIRKIIYSYLDSDEKYEMREFADPILHQSIIQEFHKLLRDTHDKMFGIQFGIVIYDDCIEFNSRKINGITSGLRIFNPQAHSLEEWQEFAENVLEGNDQRLIFSNIKSKAYITSCKKKIEFGGCTNRAPN